MRDSSGFKVLLAILSRVLVSSGLCIDIYHDLKGCRGELGKQRVKSQWTEDCSVTLFSRFLSGYEPVPSVLREDHG